MFIHIVVHKTIRGAGGTRGVDSLQYERKGGTYMYRRQLHTLCGLHLNTSNIHEAAHCCAIYTILLLRYGCNSAQQARS